MKVGFVSLGCPKNLVDGEVMLGYAREAGHEITADSGDADVIVVNTCAFIDNAKQESIDAILEMAQHKKNGGSQRLIVTGCLAERYRNDLVAEIPEIDAVLGTGEVPDIVGEFASLAEAKDSDIEADAFLLIRTGETPDLDDDPSVESLTPREIEVLELVAEGLSNKAVASGSRIRQSSSTSPQSRASWEP